MKKTFQRREFLNKIGHHSHARVLIDADSDRMSISISDCNGTINLYESFGKKRYVLNAIHKIKTLVHNLTELLAFVESLDKQPIIGHKRSFSSFDDAHNFLTVNGYKPKPTILTEQISITQTHLYSKMDEDIEFHAVIGENTTAKRLKWRVQFEE